MREEIGLFQVAFGEKGIAVPFNLFNSPRDTPAPGFPWQPSQLKRVSEVRRTVCQRDEKRKVEHGRGQRDGKVPAENLKLRTSNSVRLTCTRCASVKLPFVFPLTSAVCNSAQFLVRQNLSNRCMQGNWFH